jgi:hypothetical protein
MSGHALRQFIPRGDEFGHERGGTDPGQQDQHFERYHAIFPVLI